MVKMAQISFHSGELEDFPDSDGPFFDGALYVCDGGLACFVSKWVVEDDSEPNPISMCNPLTGSWKDLPLRNLSEKKPILVQLVMDVDAKGDKVILICHEKIGEALEADSKIGSWCGMDSSLVYGIGDTLLGSFIKNRSPLVFDCTNSALVLKAAMV